jgi:hypothetical protein
VWPFQRKQKAAAPPGVPEQIHYSQLDITEHFGDDRNLASDAWIATQPLNASTPDPVSAGLPAVDASAEEVYSIASKLSEIRESVPVPNDGIYCPICHIANVDLGRLHTPCPKCARPLLKFGWD